MNSFIKRLEVATADASPEIRAAVESLALVTAEAEGRKNEGAPSCMWDPQTNKSTFVNCDDFDAQVAVVKARMDEIEKKRSALMGLSKGQRRQLDHEWNHWDRYFVKRAQAASHQITPAERAREEREDKAAFKRLRRLSQMADKSRA
jgi:hypothetical protein